MPTSARDVLDTLIGTWELEVSVGGTPGGSDRMAFSWMRVVFEHVGDSPLIVQRSNVVSPAGVPAGWLENAPAWTTSVIGADDARGQFTQLYADSRGVQRVYQMRIDDDVWTSWRDEPGFFQRFEGRISADGDSIVGHWDASADGKRWERDFDLVYTRQ